MKAAQKLEPKDQNNFDNMVDNDLYRADIFQLLLNRFAVLNVEKYNPQPEDSKLSDISTCLSLLMLVASARYLLWEKKLSLKSTINALDAYRISLYLSIYHSWNHRYL